MNLELHCFRFALFIVVTMVKGDGDLVSDADILIFLNC